MSKLNSTFHHLKNKFRKIYEVMIKRVHYLGLVIYYQKQKKKRVS